MSISMALIPAALLLKVILFDKDYCQLQEIDKKAVKDVKLPTNYRDKELLIKTLNDFNAHGIKVKRDDIVCSVGKHRLRFIKENENYMVSLSAIKNSEQLLEELRCLDGLYKANLQEQVYKSTKEQLKQRGMMIESEEILEDNSIILTVSV